MLTGVLDSTMAQEGKGHQVGKGCPGSKEDFIIDIVYNDNVWKSEKTDLFWHLLLIFLILHGHFTSTLPASDLDRPPFPPSNLPTPTTKCWVPKCLLTSLPVPTSGSSYRNFLGLGSGCGSDFSNGGKNILEDKSVKRLCPFKPSVKVQARKRTGIYSGHSQNHRQGKGMLVRLSFERHHWRPLAISHEILLPVVLHFLHSWTCIQLSSCFKTSRVAWRYLPFRAQFCQWTISLQCFSWH